MYSSAFAQRAKPELESLFLSRLQWRKQWEKQGNPALLPRQRQDVPQYLRILSVVANAEIVARKSSVIGQQISRNLDINPVTGRRVTWTRVTNQPPVGHRWGAGGWKGSSNGAEPNCNSCYHGSSRQRGGADGSLGRFTTTSFIQNLGKFLHG